MDGRCDFGVNIILSEIRNTMNAGLLRFTLRDVIKQLNLLSTFKANWFNRTVF